jgi:L-cystine uptake protein TcyP (sodium:dicarboxylate symporter family)
VPFDSLVAFFLLTMYVIGGGFMEHKKFKFGHETSIALILGLAFSAMINFIPALKQQVDLSF